jgi:hypothetical protein
VPQEVARQGELRRLVLCAPGHKREVRRTTDEIATRV